MWPEQAAVLVLLAVVGAGNTLVDVAGLTLLQRAVPDDVLARVFGVLESLVLATVALGAVLAPIVIGELGVRAALVATGAFLPMLTLVTWSRLRSIDASAPFAAEELAALQSVPIFTALPPQKLEALASQLERVAIPAGEAIFRQGGVGDRFYVVAEGEVDITVDGALATTEGPGGYFGEIALLRDVPRTGTATARTDAALWALDRAEFVAAVTGHAESAEAADAVVAARLSSLRPQVASL